MVTALGSLQIPGEASIPATMHHPKNLTRACGVKVWAGGHAVWRRGESYRTTTDISALGPGEQSCGRASLFHGHGCSELSWIFVLPFLQVCDGKPCLLDRRHSDQAPWPGLAESLCWF